MSNDPYPSLLAPVSPFPYPTTAADAHAGKVPPEPLTSSELHLRLIMQSLANQVSMEWNRPACGEPNGGPLGAEHPACDYLKLCVPSRDYMVMRVPAHELTKAEIEDLKEVEKENAAVMKSWAEDGGAYVVDLDGRRRWVGIEPEPKE